jgi:predicted aconitase with swiveling domain
VVANESVLRVARDVDVISTTKGLVVISNEPSIVGDALMLEMVVDNHIARVAVRVEDSQPIVVAGAIRHRIGLSRTDPER